MTTTTHTHDHLLIPEKTSGFDVLSPLRRWVNQIQVRDRHIAHLICRLIPCCCPFERDITLFGHTFHIPALCKFNPLYNELVGLRFRSLSYLCDECGENVRKYLC